MKEEFVFYESQRLNQWWFFLLLLAINALFICGCIIQLGTGKPWGNNPMSDNMLIIVTVLVILFTISFFFIRLDTVINEEGIFIKIFPFFLRYKFFPWNNISKAYIRKYNPVLEYGGWGIRFKFSSTLNANVAYSMSGNIGLQLELINGKRILIGTCKPVEMEEIVRNLENLKE
jgi:hypothetical protein